MMKIPKAKFSFCPQCGMDFKHQESLERHIKTVHEGVKKLS